ncbi:SDR family oxidoreductase [Rhodococcus sp. ZPP]|uniref:SDR family oxidoreductase n=1 Tax=Rhodococcus sp. ZPP TaxID=2749906 RepID=UPI00244DC4E2|nr:SDR family oxidoreductase [Rhodococcus sp. ZPP]
MFFCRRHGATVAIAENNDTAGQALAAELTDRYGRPATSHPVDAASAPQVQDWVDTIADTHGRIVFCSSMSWRGNFGQANYVAAEAGIVGLTRTIALEAARDGITANAIAPGLIETPMLACMNGPARDKLVSKVPQKRTGDPTDIAEAGSGRSYVRCTSRRRSRL